MDSSSSYKFNPHLPSGFILQKDVYTTNLLYANDQFPIKKLSKLLPFRPPTGCIPQDPSTCLKIIRQNGFISYNTENKTIFYSKNTFKPKKLNNRKLKFPIPKYKLPPLSATDFYGSLRGKNIRIKYIEDDLNITSKKGKKIFYTFKEHYFSKYESKEKSPKKNIIKKKKQNKSMNYFDQYFDFGFHSRNNDPNNKEKTLKNQKSFSQFRVNIFPKKKYPKDKTFATQIDFNLLVQNKKFHNRARTANIRSHMFNPNNFNKKKI